ncbi:hypothetical protein [Mesorhizobium sp.]|uniref:hypothetical protein n=1 Tax=Mesorhizobium sp. TaxID=1871066 RepID=UPI0026205C1A|nr:hypothetical protein [Mesorhizobium sp.]
MAKAQQHLRKTVRFTVKEQRSRAMLPRRGQLMSGLDQDSRCLFDLIGRMVDLFDLLRQPIVEHRKPCGVVDGASLSAV